MQVFRTLSVFTNKAKFLFPKTIPTRCYCNSLQTTQPNIKINIDSISKYITKLELEYNLLKDKHGNNIGKARLAELQPIVNLLEEREHVSSILDNLTELLHGKDDEIRQLAEEEKKVYEDMIAKIDEDMINTLLPKDDTDKCNAVMLEINAGVGGQEAMLFAQELFEMYCRFAEYKGWHVQVADFQVTEKGGVRHASVIITGRSAYRFYKYEAGVHRVQRIPVTEKSGRLHTSTATVNTLPQPTDLEVTVNTKDLKVETKRATGAGGQHVNTTDSAVRITHVPSGISVECQVDRSQFKNKQIAMQKLKALLYKKEMDEQAAKADSIRRNQVQSKFRNEKVRTYNYQQDRVSDHRIQGHNFYNLVAFMQGGQQLEKMIQILDENERIVKLLNVINGDRRCT